MNELKKRINKSKEQKGVLYNIEMFYKTRSSVIKFFVEYSTMIAETKYKTFHGKGIKKLIPEQIFRQSPIALAQVKVGKT